MVNSFSGDIHFIDKTSSFNSIFLGLYELFIYLFRMKVEYNFREDSVLNVDKEMYPI